MGALLVALYPELAPPKVQVSAIYPRADAETISETAAGPLESKINGVDNMIYLSSNSANDGSYNLTVSFKVGSDPDMSTVNVQNGVSQAMAELPEEVKRQGVTTTKQSTNMLLAVNLFSPNGTYDTLFLNHYANINVTDSLARIDGVGEASMRGVQEYATRIWVNPESLASLGLTGELFRQFSVTMSVAVFDHWSKRDSPELHEQAIVDAVRPKLNALPFATVLPFPMPPIPGLGSTAGFEFVLQSTAGDTPQNMAAVLGGLAVAANQTPELSSVFSTFKASVPQIYLDIDREKAKTLGVPLQHLPLHHDQRLRGTRLQLR